MDCGEYGIDDAKKNFNAIMSRIHANDKEEFLAWISSDQANEPNGTEKARVERRLRKIATKLRQIVSLDGSTATERLDWPTEGKFAECTEDTTVHVDQFLYDDEDLDELAEAGHVPRYSCRSCGSRDVRPLNIISHSLSIDNLTYLFTQLLPSLGIDLTAKKLVDVGSRLGVVLYAAVLSNPTIRSATGIELNPEFCDIQRATLSEFRLSKASVICADVRNCEEVFRDADVVTMHNVFGFFLSQEDQVSCWASMRQFLRPGTFLVHRPSVDDVTNHLQLGFRPVADWLELVVEKRVGVDDDYGFYVYKVKPLP